MSRKHIPFNELAQSDLVVDATYEGGSHGNIKDDPLSRLMGCRNLGGFRPVGRLTVPDCKFVVLYSSLDDPDWHDRLDPENGLFFYYGDNKSPGHKLHETPKKGNLILRDSFDLIHSSPPKRSVVSPFFVFTKGVAGRDVVFRGLAAPGSLLVGLTDDLVAIWKSKEGERFQNYRAYFTILDESTISRAWINDLLQGEPLSSNCPETWRRWLETGDYSPLQAPPTLEYRKKSEQLPSSKRNQQLVDTIYDFFKEDPYEFEHCAAKIATMMDANIVSIDVTRRWRDGGRDAVGLYRIGTERDNIKVEFALEAKCFDTGTAVGIRHTSRLISRLKHRQFGILVTTSFVHKQAYEEIRADEHPVIIMAAEDIANILIEAGKGSAQEVSEWLKTNFSSRQHNRISA